MLPIEDILSKEDLRNLREDLDELLNDQECFGDLYGEVEELLLSYGLEMDYIDQLIY